jgi:hypothetical protein
MVRRVSSSREMAASRCSIAASRALEEMIRSPYAAIRRSMSP